MTDAELQTLKTEIATDPLALGYTSDDPDTAAKLNEVGLSSETLPNDSASVDEVMDAIDFSELSVLDANGLNAFWTRMQLADGGVDISVGNAIITQAAEVFTLAGAPNSRAALNALQTRDASRAEVLFGAGRSVTHLDVGQARLI